MTETWNAWILPPGFTDVPPPKPRCHWCQRPAADDGMCPGCAIARSGPPEPAGVLRAWGEMDPAARRLLLACAHGRDPWADGEPVVILLEETSADGTGVSVTRTRVRSAAVPRSSWDVEPGR